MASVNDQTHSFAKVSHKPPCDVCLHYKIDPPRTAEYDAAIPGGPWAYLCIDHFHACGASLGLGRGQQLIVSSS